MTATGVMICGHGSRSQSAVDEFAALADKLPSFLPEGWETEYGYLEFANPVIRDGLDRLREKKCDRILAVPGMLFAAMHAKNDIPTVLNSYAEKHDIEISYGRELGIDPKMIAAAADRIMEAIERANQNFGELGPHDTCLVLIGRGASDPDANANVAKIARLLQEGLGFGWCEVGYSGVTFPLVEPCLRHAVKLGYKRIVVFPYFLFSGILVDRIFGFTDMVSNLNPHIQFAKAGYLGDHPKVLETFAERVMELSSGTPPPNCGICRYRAQILTVENGTHRRVAPEERRKMATAGMEDLANEKVPPPTCVMCKYRTAVLGFESEVGALQESHHHHVEGQGANAPGSNVDECTLCSDFCTGLCRLEKSNPHHHHHHDDDGHHHHSHHHFHPEYPHAAHPHGPESVRRTPA
ncbi:MAG: sirohydrochlorin chelatase [Roseovarius sp.]|nr:sirohydrochlorin chelatase [Roseovarius sp.]